jgi:hypothetical protein
MIKLIIFLLLTVCIIAGCKKAKSTCPSDNYSYQITNNASIDTIRPDSFQPLVAVTVNGNSRVFSYAHDHTECANLIDGGSVSTLVFEVDPSLTIFKFYADDLQKINCYYRISYPESSVQNAYVPVGGIIEGTMQNDKKWQVSIDVKLNNNETLTTSAVFEVK